MWQSGNQEVADLDHPCGKIHRQGAYRHLSAKGGLKPFLDLGSQHFLAEQSKKGQAQKAYERQGREADPGNAGDLSNQVPMIARIAVARHSAAGGSLSPYPMIKRGAPISTA